MTLSTGARHENLRTGLQGRLLRVQGVGASGVVNDIQFCKNGDNVLAMSTLVKAGWTLHVEAVSAAITL